MIKTKNGQEVKIVSRNSKSTQFVVKAVYPELTMEQMFSQAGQAALRNRFEKKFKVSKSELVFDNELELRKQI